VATKNRKSQKSKKSQDVPLLELRGVTFNYPRIDEPALKDIDFRLKVGESVALLGANGSGKTTLLMLFVGVLWPTGGEVLLEGKTVTRGNVRHARRRIGVLFQNPDDQVFAPTVSQDVAFGPTNLGLPADEVQKRVDWSLSMVGIERYAERSSHNLSKGELKRVALAGVVAMKPQVLLLDEPFSGLDAPGRRDAIELVRTVHSELGAAIVIATHETDVVSEVASRAVVLSGGEVALQGRVGMVLNHPELETLGVQPPPLFKLSSRLRAGGVSVPRIPTLKRLSNAILSGFKK
jgi:cobalt/nickel transport system ATP-binding protein